LAQDVAKPVLVTILGYADQDKVRFLETVVQCAEVLGPRWKVLFVMAFTVGLFGSLFFFVERFTARAVAGGHRLVRTLPLAMPFWVAHAAILLALFFLYAHYLGIRVL
jgi:hypothetical protein